jgi:hypothetical protein
MNQPTLCQMDNVHASSYECYSVCELCKELDSLKPNQVEKYEKIDIEQKSLITI